MAFSHLSRFEKSFFRQENNSKDCVFCNCGVVMWGLNSIVWLIGLSSAEVPEESIKSTEHSLEAKEQILERLNKHADVLVQSQFRKQILEKLLMNNPVDVPSLMANQEAERQRKRMCEQYMPKEFDIEKIPLDSFIKTSKKDVAIGLLLGHFISSKSIQVDKEEVIGGIKQHLKDNNMSDNLVNYILDDKSQYERFQAKLVEDKAIEQIIQSSQVTTEDKAYADLLDSNN